MKSVSLLLVSLLAPLSLSYAATCKPGERSSLPVAMHPQETSMWCWAASGQMVMAYLGHNQSQCLQASERFGIDCLCKPCTGGGGDQSTRCQSSRCVMGGWPELRKYGFDYERTCHTALSWDELRQQLSANENCRKTPVLFTWHWVGGGGHMLVAKGYDTLNGVNYVSVLNPWSPCPGKGDASIIPYDFYVEHEGHYTHWHDYYNIAYKGKGKGKEK